MRYKNVSLEQARWRPKPDKWSLLEVINHLWDEEIADFRARLTLMLEDTTKDWLPIDPMGWVIERKYNERDLVESLNGFLNERDASIKWLESLEQPAWDSFKEHPYAGRLSAGDLLTSWIAHDLLHIRQIVNCHLDYYEKESEPFSMSYAKP